MPAMLLFTGIVRPERARRLSRTAAARRFFSGWGDAHDREGRGALQSDVLSQRLGLAARQRADRAGPGPLRRPEEAARVFGAGRAADLYGLHRLPELFCGFQRGKGRGPTLYPVACSPQAWAAATPFALLEASLGFEFDPRAREIRLRNPRLPEFLDEVIIRDLRLGTSQVDFVVRRHGTEISVQVLRGGNVRVSVVFESKQAPSRGRPGRT